MHHAHNKEVLTTGEVAAVCRVAARTVSKWIDSGRLDGYRIPGSRDRRVTRVALEEFVRKHALPLPTSQSTTAQRILLVDADLTAAGAFEQALHEKSNREIRVAKSAFEAGVVCERLTPHWMIVDVSIGMAEVRGLLSWMRSEGSTCKVAVMGHAFTSQDEATLRQAGARTILRKPFTLRVVVDMIDNRYSAAG